MQSTTPRCLCRAFPSAPRSLDDNWAFTAYGVWASAMRDMVLLSTPAITSQLSAVQDPHVVDYAAPRIRGIAAMQYQPDQLMQVWGIDAAQLGNAWLAPGPAVMGAVDGVMMPL